MLLLVSGGGLLGDEYSLSQISESLDSAGRKSQAGKYSEEEVRLRCGGKGRNFSSRALFTQLAGKPTANKCAMFV